MKLRELLLWTILLILAVLIWIFSSGPKQSGREIAFSDFMARVDSGAVTRVTITDHQLIGTTKGSETFGTQAPADLGAVVPRLLARRVQIDVRSGSSRSPTIAALAFYTSTILPWFTFVLVIVCLVRVSAVERRLEGLRDGGDGRARR